MRELFVVADESTDSLWVLRDLDGEKFCIPREDLIPSAAPTLTAVDDDDEAVSYTHLTLPTICSV